MAKNEKTKSIVTECGSCSGTGIYVGFAEPTGVGVVCLTCNGSGKAVQTFKPFISRKERSNIRIVRCSAGSFIGTGVGPTGDSVTYADFKAGKMPTRSKK